jgi:hypothetical protein
MRTFVAALAISALPMGLGAQAATLPSGLSQPTKVVLERVIDSARMDGIPVEPLFAKVAEGKLKQAADAQIVTAVRALANRLRSIRSEIGPALDVPSMTAAATALASGIPIAAIRDMRDAAAGSPSASADLAGALITATDLVAQRVSPASATAAVQSLLARRAAPEQFARLRASVGETIAAGRAPDQAAKTASESIVKGLPPSLPSITTVKPPVIGDASGDAQVPSAPSTTRNSK